MGYVDGYVAAVPTDEREAYIVHARAAAAVFRDHGAFRVADPRMQPDANPMPLDGERLIYGGFTTLLEL